MNAKTCINLGLVIGGAVGVIVGLLHGLECCMPPQPPTWSQLALDGLIVAMVAVLFCVAFAIWIVRLPSAPILVLSLLIGLLVGVLLGPIAYRIPHPWLALLICSLLGALIAWIVCRFLCGRSRNLKFEEGR